MKKSTKCLFALLLMLGAMLEMKAADVYLLTAQTINGIVGNYEVPSNHKLAPNTSYGDNVYSLNPSLILNIFFHQFLWPLQLLTS